MVIQLKKLNKKTKRVVKKKSKRVVKKKTKQYGGTDDAAYFQKLALRELESEKDLRQLEQKERAEETGTGTSRGKKETGTGTSQYNQTGTRTKPGTKPEKPEKQQKF
jgi:hypothetical protein